MRLQFVRQLAPIERGRFRIIRTGDSDSVADRRDAAMMAVRVAFREAVRRNVDGSQASHSPSALGRRSRPGLRR